MNKKERMLTVFRGEKPDVTPAGFWFHYSPEFSEADMIRAHVKLYQETDMDIVKIMQDYPYPVEGKIKSPEDWHRISIKGIDSPEFSKMANIIKGIRAEVGEDVFIFQTMFGPFKAASMAFGEEILMEHSKKYPEDVKAGIQIIADGLEMWAKEFLNVGADGIYYSAQYGEVGRFTYEEWERLVKPYDLQILRVPGQEQYVLLHICGEPEYKFKTNLEWFKEYPATMVNWSVKDNNCSLTKGKELFRKPVLGGLNNKGNILNGEKSEIEEEVLAAIEEVGQAGFMIGADCTIQGKNISIEKIAYAVSKAHNY